MRYGPSYGERGEFLYHYTKLATAVEDIIPSQTLRLSPFRKLNDPREASDWMIGAGAYGEESLDEEYWKAQRITNRLKDTCKVLCLTEDAADPLSGEFGRGYARARMWAQYADNHRGVCLLFDRAALEKLVRPTLTELGEVFSGSVDYRDEGIPTRATWYDLNAVHRDGIDASLDELVRDHWTFSRSDGGTASP